MERREIQIIRRNEKFLRDNVDAMKVAPFLIQNAIITIDDAERIEKEVTFSDKAHKLLRIIETHPNGFKQFHEALTDNGMDFVASRLDSTEVDENHLKQEKDEYDKQIIDILGKTYKFSDDVKHYVILNNIEEEVRLEFRLIGEVFNVHIDHLKILVGTCFPKCVPYKRKKTKEWAFKNLLRNRQLEEDEKEWEISKAQEMEPTGLVVSQQVDGQGDSVVFEKTEPKYLSELSEQELSEVLKPRLQKEGIPQSILKTIVEEEITGNVFKRLKLEYMEATFTDISKGKRISILYLRDEICREEEETGAFLLSNIIYQKPVFQMAVRGSDEQENVGHYRETFRKFDRDASETESYRRNAMLISHNNRPSTLLDPVHVFFFKDEKEIPANYSTISDKIVEFVAACMNERTNGTIHIGVDPKSKEFQIEGEIKGCYFERNTCLQLIYKKIDERFYKEQVPLILKCMRPPKFIDVSSKEKQAHPLRVLEVDVVPQAILVSEEAFFIRSKDEKSKPVLYLFSEKGVSPQHVSDERSVAFMSKYKNLLTETRKNQESNPKITNIKPNVRQKILDLLSAGDETMSSSLYPLLFLSPLDSNSVNEMGNLDFLIDLDPNAIFDFDFSAENKGLYEHFDTDKEQALKALTSDNFDPNSDENKFKTESLSNLLEDIRLSVLKPWVFCNGYEAMNKTPMNIMDWKHNRSKGFKEAIRFYNNEIPQGRALILIFLMSKDYDIMLEAAEETILTFKDQWVVFAENEEIANHWNDELIKRHTADKETIKARTVIGMPWSHVNQTIKELTGSNRSHRCEISTSSGAFCYLKDKVKNDLIDLEILGRNECDDPELLRDRVKIAQIRREEAEKFYRGENVSWWNFVFPDIVLKRDVHGQLRKKVENALEGTIADEDNKIGLVNIYHQPGAGATTTAKHILWDMRATYRCCIVKQITDQTVDQITTFRNFDEMNDPKPPLVLIENKDEEKVGELFALLQHRARIMARRSSDMKVFCVLLLCTRRANIHATDATSVALKHELSQKELAWFRTRYKDLQKQFEDEEGTDPRFLISFNILKENFNVQYIHRTAVELVKGVTNQNEKNILKYLSMLNTFDLDFQSVPISAFDPIMTPIKRGYKLSFGLTTGRGKRLNKLWEQTISQPLQILLNRNSRAGFGRQILGLSIVNPLFAAEIFSCFNQEPETASKIVLEFFESPIFRSSNNSVTEVKKVVRTIMKKREEKEDSGKKVKFSPLIMKILEDENEEIAATVLMEGFKMTEDPMICQQIARLYIHCKNWKMAAKYAEIATTMKPQNSFLWDTYGQVYKNQLYDKYNCFLQEGKGAIDADIEEAVQIAQHGLRKFKKEQEACEIEHFNKVNDAGYYGELRMIVLLLDVLQFCPLMKQKGCLHRYLTDTEYFPKEMPKLKPESVDFMKSLERRSEITLKAIDDKTTQLKEDMFYSIFGQGGSRRREIAILRENLDNYFGEESDIIPDNLSDNDKAEFRRRRVRRLGGRSLSNFIHIKDPQHLDVILDMMLDNVKSDVWQPFDIVNLFNVIIAMKIQEKQQTKVSYAEMVHLSKKCYDKVISSVDTHPFLEAFMYFVLLNWPTKSRIQTSNFICATEQMSEATKKWKAAFIAKHPRQRESRPVRQRETTNFFLGRGNEMDAVVHYEELLDPWGKKFVRGDKVWESPDFVKKLLRLPGTLINDGTEINCNVETRSGATITIPIPTSFPIGVRSLWQKRVYFVLGFSWAGIKAYDVRSEIPEIAKPMQRPTPSVTATRSTSKKSETDMHRKTEAYRKTHEVFMEKLTSMKKKIEQIEMDKLGGGVGKEKRQYLDREQSRYKEKLNKLLEARKEFYGT